MAHSLRQDLPVGCCPVDSLEVAEPLAQAAAALAREAPQKAAPPAEAELPLGYSEDAAYAAALAADMLANPVGDSAQRAEQGALKSCLQPVG